MLPSVFYETSIPPKLDKDSSIKRKLYSNNLYGHRCKNPQCNIAKLNEQNKKVQYTKSSSLECKAGSILIYHSR